MSLKRRVLPPRPQPSQRTAPPARMKTIALPTKAKGLRINCDGCFVIITRTERGTIVQVERNFGFELLTKRSFESHYQPTDTSVIVEAKR